MSEQDLDGVKLLEKRLLNDELNMLKLYSK